MAFITSVKISGFWGDRKVELSLNESINFLIGRNGSGKTTAINMIAAAMTGDIESLDRLPFESIEITLASPDSRKLPSIRVDKDRSEDFPYPEIVYSIKESASSKPRKFSLVDYAEERYFRGEPVRIIQSPASRARKRSSDLMRVLREIAPVSWLSIQRTSSQRSFNERPSRESSVDSKIQEINERLVRYFSELGSEAGAETRKFQRKLFLSLIEFDERFSSLNSIQELNLEKEQEAIEDIFRRFEVPESQYSSRTNAFFAKLRELRDREEVGSYTTMEVVHLVNSWRVHSLAEQWFQTVDAERKLLEPREAFLGILNKMFHRKCAEVLGSNDLIFRTESGKNLSTFDLSSGEKQLFIILAEALLQRSKPCIYIADEPELSLHIDWQEALVESLVELNPENQILFATHSPDVVSHFSDKVIDMEEVIK